MTRPQRPAPAAAAHPGGGAAASGLAAVLRGAAWLVGLVGVVLGNVCIIHQNAEQQRQVILGLVIIAGALLMALVLTALAAILDARRAP